MKPDLDFSAPVKPRRKRRLSMLLFAVGIVCLWVAGMGLVRVSTTNEIASIGRKHRSVEKEIADLELASNNADLDISEAMSRPDVKERLMASRSRLKRIKSSEIVYLTVSPAGKESTADNKP